MTLRTTEQAQKCICPMMQTKDSADPWVMCQTFNCMWWKTEVDKEYETVPNEEPDRCEELIKRGWDEIRSGYLSKTRNFRRPLPAQLHQGQCTIEQLSEAQAGINSQLNELILLLHNRQ